MSQSPSPSRSAKTLSHTVLHRIAIFSALALLGTLPAMPAAAQSACDLARNGCGQIVPATCGGTPATPTPQANWGELKPTDVGALPPERDSTSFNEFGHNYDSVNWFEGLSIQNNYLVTGSSHGLAVWDLHADAAHPHFLGRLTDASFPVWAIEEVKWPLQDIAMPAGDDTLAALSGESNIGIGIVDLTSKSSPRLLYQNYQKSGEEVYAATIGGKAYAFLAASGGSPSGGAFVYNMTAARSFSGCSEAVPAAGAVTSCPGVYVGKMGSLTSVGHIHGVDNFVVLSSASSGGFEIWNVANPASPVRVMTGLNQPPVCQFDNRSVYGVAMWKNGTHYYLGLRTSSYSCTAGRTINEARIYDVSCVSGTCTGLGSPLWTRELDSDTPNYFVTYSHGAGSDYLYFGSDNRCGGTSQREFLYDVTVPGAPHDVTPPSNYWGWYYRGNPTGFNYVMPRRGMFNGTFFYRAALSILDVHQRVGAVAPQADFSFSPQAIYPGDTVTFTDQSSGSPTSWSWNFGVDGTATNGTSTTSQNPQVKFAAKGTKTVSLTSTNSIGPSPLASHPVTVLDPSPQIGTVTVSPASPLQCQPVTLTATGVTGQATLGYSWKITDPASAVAPGGTSTVNPFIWDTHLNNPLPQAYTATITVANGVGTASQSATFTLGSLPALPTGSFAPTNSAFSAGTVQLNVAVAGATEWNWDFGDGAGFTGWTSDPIAGPNPSHTYTSIGNKTVVVKVRNCLSDPNGLQSSGLVVDILQISPLIASFQASCAFAPCSFNAGQSVSFVDQSQGAQTWDYDWSHSGADGGTCSYSDAGHTSPVTSHIFATSGTYQPCLRVHRGSETNVFVHPALRISSVVTLPATLSISGPSSGAPGQALSFSATGFNCTPSPTGWAWSLPGGTPPTATTATVSVTYSAVGLHTLSVTNSACAGAFASAGVNVSSNNGGGGGGSLGAVFSFLPTAPTTGQSVSFDASASTGSPTLYSWVFGDGQTGSGKATSHTYTQAGNYNVVLTVCSAATCVASNPQAVVVQGGVPPLDPNFTSSANCFNQFGVKECDGQAAVVTTLTAATTQATSYSWSFGDGSTGTGASVSHTWAAAGNYNVTLTVANSQTNATLTLLFKISAPTVTAQSVLLPWIASTRGVLTQSSDLYVHNPGSTSMDVTLEFRRRLGTPEDNPPRATRTVAPGATLFSSDVLNDLFDRPENTVGYVTVGVQSGVAPIITSYNTTFQSNGSQFGQTISGVSMPTSSTQSAQASPQASPVQQLVALNDNADEVSYFGLSNPNNGPSTYRLSLFDSQGKAIGAPTSFTMARLGLQQFQREDIESLFGVSNVHDYRVQIETVSGGTIYPYGAKVRTVSLDPSFVRPGNNLSKVYILGALSTPGLNNTVWRSDLLLVNPGTTAIQTTLSYISAGLGNSPLAPITVVLQPGETQRLSNVIADKWSVTDAVGTITVATDPASGSFPLVQGESYDFSQAVRLFGQAMPALSDADAAGVGQGNYMVGLRQDATHWTALWLFNPSTDVGTYDLVYRGLDGTVLGQTTGIRMAAGKTKLIRPSEHPIPAAGVQGGFTVQIMVRSGKVLAAGQVVNLTTNDPAYIVGATR